MTPTIRDLVISFIGCNKQLTHSNNILQLARMLQVVSQPVVAISVELFVNQPTRVINLFRSEQNSTGSYVIIGANEHIYLIEKQKIIVEDIECLHFVCKLCEKTFNLSSEWLVHVNGLSCVVTNPCRWLPDLYDIPSLNRAYYTHIIASYYRIVRANPNPHPIMNNGQNGGPADDLPPPYEEINNN